MVLAHDKTTQGSSDTSSGSPTASDYRLKRGLAQSRKPIPRKGHTKSRRGCFNCKRRRIKCDEKHPDCSHCIKAGLQCDYPANIIQLTQRLESPPHPQDAVKLCSTPGIFTMADMRLFHHFIVTAYPHLPVESDNIWIIVIQSFAHNYAYLIHSILALSASHLEVVSNSPTPGQAIRHRSLAVESLNEALSAPPKSRSEQKARMAAALALTFPSSHLQDGLAEFLTTVKGCNLLASEGTPLASDPAFNASSSPSITTVFSEDGHLQQMKNQIATAPQFNCVNHEDLNLATISLRSIQYFNMSSSEEMYWAALDTTLQSAYDRPIDAYTSFDALYNIASRWSHDEFQAFVDPSNAIAQILQAHFIAIQVILTPILYPKAVAFEGLDVPTATMGSIEVMYRNLPNHLRHHVEWPRQVSQCPFTRFLGQPSPNDINEQTGNIGLLSLEPHIW